MSVEWVWLYSPGEKYLQIQACFGLPWKFPPPSFPNIISPRSQWQNSEIVPLSFLEPWHTVELTEDQTQLWLQGSDPSIQHESLFRTPGVWGFHSRPKKNDVLKADSWRYWQMQIDAQHPHIHGTVVIQTMQLLQHKMYDSGSVQVSFLSSRFKSTIYIYI